MKKQQRCYTISKTTPSLIRLRLLVRRRWFSLLLQEIAEIFNDRDFFVFNSTLWKRISQRAVISAWLTEQIYN